MELLNPGHVKASQQLKVTLVSLALQRLVAIRTESVRRMFGRVGKVVHLSVKDSPSGELARPAAAILSIVRATDGGTIGDFVTRAQQAYGKDLKGFVGDIVVPGLIARGLLEIQAKKVLHLITVGRRVRTAAGEAERARLEAAFDQARSVPSFLTTDPKQAAAIAASLGGLILLVDELKPHFKQISNSMRTHGVDASDDDMDIVDFGDDAFDLASFDDSIFDSMDSAISSLESSLESAVSDAGGDGGGDGGGDSGGGGNGGGC